MKETSDSGRMIELDGVRGIAALLVVYQHLFLMWIPSTSGPLFWLKTASGMAWTGVTLFFVLSGFLIGGILLRNQNTANYFQVFYTRRAFRILPLYYFLLAVYFFIRYFTSIGRTASFEPSRVPEWSYLALIQNLPMAIFGDNGAPVLAVTWSVTLEEQFYLFFPPLIRFTPARWHLPMLGAMTLVGPALRCFFPSPPSVSLSIEAFFIGAILAYFYINRPQVFASKKWRAFIAVIFLFSAFGMALVAIGKHFGPFRDTILTVFWTAVLWLVISLVKTPWTALFRAKPLRWVGSISYGVYLFHVLIYHVVFLLIYNRWPFLSAGWHGVMLAVLSFLITLIFAWISYRFVERHLIQIGQRAKYSSQVSEAAPLPTTTLNEN